MKTILTFVIISTLLLFGCSTTTITDSENPLYIEKPEEINFYHSGEIIHIEKDTQQYNIILSLINKGIADTANSGIMKYIKRQIVEETVKTSGYALELVYAEAIHSELMIDRMLQIVNYERVFIPLDNNIIFLGDDEGYGKKGLSITFMPKEFVVGLLGDKS